MIAERLITRLELRKMIKAGIVKLGGNAKLKIYGTLDCASGKRMKKQNRVFFSTEQEAITAGYRPCGHCLREKYLQWKKVASYEIRSSKLVTRGFQIELITM